MPPHIKKYDHVVDSSKVLGLQNRDEKTMSDLLKEIETVIHDWENTAGGRGAKVCWGVFWS